MMRRFALLGLLALSLGASGCATTVRRTDSVPPILGKQTWNQAPAPPQRPVAQASKTVAEASDSPNATPTGLSKYFPGLHRTVTETPKVVANYRPTWFGLRPKTTQSQVYTTDARAGLNRSVQETSMLPVALQVPTDRAVTPTNAETVQQPAPVDNSKPIGADPLSASVEHELPVFGGRTRKPVDEEVNPLPPAAESQAALANRMPDVPAVDPLTVPTAASPEPAPASPEPKPEPPLAAPEPKPELAPAAPEPSPAAPELRPEQAPAAPEPKPEQAPAAPELKPTPPAAPAVEEKPVAAVPAVTNPSMAAGLPEPTLPASYSLHHKAKATPASQAKPATVVMASPQSDPPKPVLPTSQAKLSSQAKPTSQAKPSPQTCTEENCCEGLGWKRPCLRRLVRRVCKMGEFADPPTAAPH